MRMPCNFQLPIYLDFEYIWYSDVQYSDSHCIDQFWIVVEKGFPVNFFAMSVLYSVS
jgi:hypothetical protein